MSSTTSHRWVLDMLPKGKKLKPLVSEFRDYVFFLNAVNCDPEDSVFFSTKPKGPESFNDRFNGGRYGSMNKLVGMFFTGLQVKKSTNWTGNHPCWGKVGVQTVFPAELCTMGIPRDPWDFLARALKWDTRDHWQYT